MLLIVSVMHLMLLPGRCWQSIPSLSLSSCQSPNLFWQKRNASTSETRLLPVLNLPISMCMSYSIQTTAALNRALHSRISIWFQRAFTQGQSTASFRLIAELLWQLVNMQNPKSAALNTFSYMNTVNWGSHTKWVNTCFTVQAGWEGRFSFTTLVEPHRVWWANKRILQDLQSVCPTRCALRRREINNLFHLTYSTTLRLSHSNRLRLRHTWKWWKLNVGALPLPALEHSVFCFQMRPTSAYSFCK